MSPACLRQHFGRVLNTTEAPTFIDLFAGCGGASLGFIAEGFRVLAAVENDPQAAEAYFHNVGLKPFVEDVRTVEGEALLEAAGLKPTELDVLIGCPPCQGFSTHRRDRRAGWDPRNRLLEEYLRLIEEVNPGSVVFENVPGLAFGKGSWRLMRVARRLTQLGYDVDWDVVQAADFGVPQFRRRLLVIASRLGSPVELPQPTHGDPTSTDVKEGRLRPWRTVRDAIGSLPALASGQADTDDDLHAARTHSPIALKRLRHIPKDGGGRFSLPANLVLECHTGHTGHRDVYGRMYWDRPAPTITSGCTNITRGRFAHPEQDRAITEREALLLQGFPSSAKVTGHHTERALQIGNMVPPALSAAAARTLLTMIAKVATSTMERTA